MQFNDRGCGVEVITDSISESGKRITTLSLVQYHPSVTNAWDFWDIARRLKNDDHVITEDNDESYEMDLSWLLGEMKYSASLNQTRKDYKAFCLSYAKTLHQNNHPVMAKYILLSALFCERYVTIEDVEDINCNNIMKGLVQNAMDDTDPKVLHHTEMHVPMYYGGVWSPHYEDESKRVFDKHDNDWMMASLYSCDEIGGGHQFQFSYNLNQWVGV